MDYIAIFIFAWVVGFVSHITMVNEKQNKKNKSIIKKMEHPYLKLEKRKTVDFEEFKKIFRKYEWWLDWSYNTALYGKDTSNFALFKHLWIVDGYVLEPSTDDDCVAIHNFILDYIRINNL